MIKTEMDEQAKRNDSEAFQIHKDDFGHITLHQQA